MSMVELGYKDFISDTFQGFLAPAKTSPAIVELLSTKSIEVLQRPAIAEQLRNHGFEVIANGPGGMRKRIDDEVPNGVTSSPKPASSPSEQHSAGSMPGLVRAHCGRGTSIP